MSETPNIYKLSNSDMKDILKSVKRDDLFKQRRLRPYVDIKKTPAPAPDVANFTAAPDYSEVITESKVEDSLKKPDTQERFFMKSKPVKQQSSFKKAYDYKVTSEKMPGEPDSPLARILPERKEEEEEEEIMITSDTQQSQSSNDKIDASDKSIESSSGQDDIIPLFLHIPKSTTCPKFCITVNVQITRTGRQIKNECRKSFICRTYQNK